METIDSEKFLLVGIGDAGLEVAGRIEEDKIGGINVWTIEKDDALSGDEALLNESKLVIVVANLGEKKENDLAYKAVQLAKEHGKVTAAILTTPRLFEGEKKIMRALEAAQKIGREVDASLIINKENFNTPPTPSSFAELINSLVTPEETIVGIIEDMVSLVSQDATVILDMEDLKIALKERGTFVVGSAHGAGDNRVPMALNEALSSPLMKKCDINSSRNFMMKILSPVDSPLTMEEMKEVSDFVGKLPSRADVKWGMETWDEDYVSVIILASGFDVNLPE